MTTSKSSAASASRKVRVNWTTREKDLIARQVYHTVPNILNTKLSLCVAVNDAQAVLVAKGELDKERVRRVKASIHVEWMKSALRMIDAASAQDRANKEQEKRESEEICLIEERKQYLIDHISELPTANLLSVLINRFADVFDAHLLPIAIPLIERLAPTLSPMIEGIVVKSLASHLNKASSGYSVNPSVDFSKSEISFVPTPAAQPRQLRVIVIGLKGTQPETIKRSFGERFDLTFFNCDVTSSQLKSALRFTDHVFYMTGFTSHTIQSILKNSKVSFDYVSGGLTSLRSSMESLGRNKETVHG